MKILITIAMVASMTTLGHAAEKKTDQSDTLIQTDTIPGSKLVINKVDGPKYIAQRKRLSDAITVFRKIAGDDAKDISNSDRQRLAAAAKDINVATAAIDSMISAGGGKAGVAILKQFRSLKYDGIEGESTDRTSLFSKRLTELDQKLSLVEPVVHR